MASVDNAGAVCSSSLPLQLLAEHRAISCKTRERSGADAQDTQR